MVSQSQITALLPYNVLLPSVGAGRPAQPSGMAGCPREGWGALAPVNAGGMYPEERTHWLQKLQKNIACMREHREEYCEHLQSNINLNAYRIRILEMACLRLNVTKYSLISGIHCISNTGGWKMLVR